MKPITGNSCAFVVYEAEATPTPKMMVKEFGVYTISKLPGGRYACSALIPATRIDKAATAASQAPSPRNTAKPEKATVGCDSGPEMGQIGVRPGTKAARAVQMFKQGVRMKDVKAALGSNFYNLLKRLETQGHKVKRAKNGTITLATKP